MMTVKYEFRINKLSLMCSPFSCDTALPFVLALAWHVHEFHSLRKEWGGLAEAKKVESLY